MLEIVSMDWLVELATNLLVSLILLAAGYLFGKRKERAQLTGRNLEQYDFYPFVVDADGFPEFSLTQFRRGVQQLLKKPDRTAAAQLILLGEQNSARYQLGPDALAEYERLYLSRYMPVDFEKPIQWHVMEWLLMQSKQTDQGIRYITLGRWQLH